MSQSINRYDRDHNIDGNVFPFTFVPEYGSSVSFENKNVHFYTADNYYKKFSKGVNGTNVKFNLKFSNKTEDEARSFLYFLENVIDSSGNYFDFNTPNSSGIEIAFPTGSIYKNIGELYVENYDFKFHNGLFDIDLNLSKDCHSSLFDWSGSSYLNSENFYTGWESGFDYEKFDVVYYSGYKEQNSNFFFKYGNYHRIVDRRDNFYYCPSGHTSEEINSPTGSNQIWSRSFFYEIDDDISIGSDKSKSILKLKDSFSSFNKMNQNDGLIKDLSLSFKNRSDKETRSIIHFLEKHEDYKPFELTLPQLYSKKKFFIVKSFSHKFVYKDCNDIELTLDEVFLFKKPDIFDNYERNADVKHFSITIETDSTEQEVQLSGDSLDSSYISVGWGDGRIDTITGINDPLLTHTYENAGTYEIHISGSIPNANLPISSHKLLVKSINQLGDIGWTNLSGFNEYSNMTSFTFGETDISLVDSMGGMFSGLTALEFVDFGSLDTSSIRNTESIFYNCVSLTELDLSNFDTSSVTGMQNMFYSCQNLSELDLSNFSTDLVTDMRGMFSNCSNLTTLDISNFDTSSVEDMQEMFSNCINLTGLDLSNFDTSSVEDMQEMFSVCSNLTTLDVSSFDTPLVADMQGMFYNCFSLTGLDLSNFDTSSVTGMQNMFYGCKDLSELDLSNFSTDLVTDMREMFYVCSNLTTLDVSSFDAPLVADMQGMFYNCVSLTGLDLSNFDTSSVTGMKNMFYGCRDLSELDLSNFDTSSVTDMREMFSNCRDLSGLDLSNFNTSSVTDMREMFYICSNLTTLDVSSFDTPLVADMQGMFYNCISLTGLDLSNFDTSSVEDMQEMFYSCNDLTTLDVSSFNTASLENMQGMFYNCVSLTGLDLSGFDTSLVTNMSLVFSKCYSLTGLNLSAFNTSSTTDMRQMFYLCQDLTGLDVSSFETSLVEDMAYMFYNCNSLTDIIGVDDFNIESIVNASNLQGFCAYVNLPTARYDSLLINWEAQDVANGIFVDFGSSQYTSGSLADSARTSLTDNYLWTINDGGSV